MTASRLTFREKCPAVCWQKQLRDRYAAEGTPPVPHLDVKRAVVRPVSRRLAEQVILKYEWLGTMAQTGHHFGIFFGAYCAGVTCVAAGAATGGVNSHCELGLLSSQLGTLARGACVHWAPRGCNSKLVSWTCRLIARAGIKAVLAYSDTDAGEVGTIYQACSWFYIGRSKPGTEQYVAPNGRVYDKKIIYDLRRKSGTIDRISWRQQRDALLLAGWRKQASNPKHRYVCVLDRSDDALIARVEKMRQPYPKRATSVDSDAAPVQGAEGGASPTVALSEPG